MSDVEEADDDILENPEAEADIRSEEDIQTDSDYALNINHSDEVLASAEMEEEDKLNIRNDDGEVGSNEVNDNNGAVDNSLAEGDQEINYEFSCQNHLAEGDQHNGDRDIDNNSHTLQNNGEAANGVDTDTKCGSNPAAEDEQYLRSNEVNFEGAEWSLEPEENSQNYQCDTEADSAAGACSGEAVESDQTEEELTARTESSGHVDRNDNVIENEAGSSSSCVHAFNNSFTQNIAEGAALFENELSVSHSNGLKQELELQAEEDVSLSLEEETIEADQVIQDELHQNDTIESDISENVISVNGNVQSVQSEDNLEASRSSNVGQVLEDEIGSLVPSESVSMVTSESYQPECDQTAVKENDFQLNPSVLTSEEAGPLYESQENKTESSKFKASGDLAVVKELEISNTGSPSPARHVVNQQAECDNKSNFVEDHESHGNKKENCDSKITDTMPKSGLNVQDLSLTSDKGAIPKHRPLSDSAPESLTDKNDEKFKCTPSNSEKSSSPEPSNSSITNTSINSKPGLIQGANNAIEDAEDALLSELDATLQADSNSSDRTSKSNNSCVTMDSLIHEDISCEQCKQNNLKCSLTSSKGNKSDIPELKEIKKQLHQSKNLLLERECQISRLKDDLEEKAARFNTVMLERDSFSKEIECLKTQNSDDLYIPQIKELEYTIAQQQNEVRSWKDKLASHDGAAKRAIATLQQEMKIRLDQMSKNCDDATKEKDSMVVKYAQAEHKNLEFKKQAERAEFKLREMEKERDAFLLKMKAIKDQRTKLGSEVEAKNSEINHLHKELDKQRELATSSDVRVKWSTNKLKTELEAHKETKVQLDKITVKLKEAKEETQQIRADCQAIIKTYQESEEVKSNSLDKELKLKETELLLNVKEKTNWELAHVRTQRELEHVKGELRDSKSQCANLSEKLSSLEGNLSQSNTTVGKYGEIIQRQKKEIQDLRERIETLVQYRTDFTRSQELIKTLDAEISELKISNKDLAAEMDACKKREMDKLELTEKLTHKNVELQSENSNLGNKVVALTGELQCMKIEYQGTDGKIKELTDSLSKEQKLRQEETQTLNTKVAGKCKAVEDLTRKLEEEKDENRTLKRKHTNNIRDLTRQLQLVRRKLENYEASTNGDKDTVSMGSRTSSNGSLNINEQPPNAQVLQPNNTVPQTTNSIQNHTANEQEYPVITEQVEVDKQVLIERIVKLQRALARKNEKIEFMEDHISQLVDEIQKKNKIIQSYILKEDSGTMTSDLSDRSKFEISRKHSIMGSVYSSHSNDGTMTLDLSLEINRKLQAVFEDTLLKNMTLKDNIDTLGQEIARLSQENRQIQLKLQGLNKSRGKGNPPVR